MAEQDGAVGARIARSTLALPTRLLRLWAQYPRIGLALRTAIAAAIASFAAQVVPDAQKYAYYGPLGPVAAVVFVRMLLSGWRVLGAVGAWVPTSAVFVLVIGAGDPLRYVAAYAGLTALGGAVATALGFVLPQLPYRPADRAVAAVRLTLVHQLRDLADLLDADTIPSREEWERRRLPLRPQIARMRNRLDTTADAQRYNVRAIRARVELTALARQGRALERTASLIEDVLDILASAEHADVVSPALGPALRPGVAEAMRRLADILLSLAGGEGDGEATREGGDALTHLAERLHRESKESDGPGLHAAAAVAHDLERILRELRPEA